MSDDERSAITAKLDMMLMFMEQIRKDRAECRQHCDAAMPEVHDRITRLKEVVDKLQGSFATHHWLLLVTELAGLVALVYLGVHK